MTTVARPTPSIGHLAEINPAEYAIKGFLGQYITSPRTHEAFTLDLKDYVTWLWRNDQQLLLAKSPDLDSYLTHLRSTVSPHTGQPLAAATISRRFGTVMQMYAWATMEDIITVNPCRRMKRPKFDRETQRRTVLSSLQFSCLLSQARADSPRAHCLVALLGMIGLRISEATSLNIASISNHHGHDIIRFTGKGNKAALMPLPGPVLRSVRECVGDREIGPLLLNHNSHRMTRANATRLLRQLGHDARIGTDFSPHSLRRTFCTSGLSSGVPLHEMTIAMRHASSNTTAIYDRLKDNLDRNASHRVASFLSGMVG